MRSRTYRLDTEKYEGLIPPNGSALIPWTKVGAGEYRLVDKWPRDAVVVYARVSSYDQTNEGQSIQLQLELAAAWCKERKTTLAAVYIDPSISATKKSTEDRIGTKLLKQVIDRQMVRTVIVYRRDRIARQASQWVEFFRLCQSKEVDLIFTATGEFPLPRDSHYTIVFETFFGLMAEMEAIALSVRSTDTYQHNRLRGVVSGPILGYIKKPGDERPKHWIRDAKKAPIVERAFELAVEGHSDAAIAKRLTKEFGTTKDGDSTWKCNARQVRRLLENPTYCGHYWDAEENLQRSNYVDEPIVSLETFLAVKERTVESESVPTGAKKKRGIDDSPYLVRDLLHCHHHRGRKMGTSNSDYTHWYVCPKCSRVRQEVLDELVMLACQKHVAAKTKKDLADLLEARAELLRTVKT